VNVEDARRQKLNTETLVERSCRPRCHLLHARRPVVEFDIIQGAHGYSCSTNSNVRRRLHRPTCQTLITDISDRRSKTARLTMHMSSQEATSERPCIKRRGWFQNIRGDAMSSMNIHGRSASVIETEEYCSPWVHVSPTKRCRRLRYPSHESDNQ
jgi:hypothetical protein